MGESPNYKKVHAAADAVDARASLDVHNCTCLVDWDRKRPSECLGGVRPRLGRRMFQSAPWTLLSKFLMRPPSFSCGQLLEYNARWEGFSTTSNDVYTVDGMGLHASTATVSGGCRQSFKLCRLHGYGSVGRAHRVV
ncbi:hypothetical protein Ae201684_003080 [Aphanomyces euteiches]|uniref:Uncharacterized protein n=1 Tax=Aphanomyces euteiches TaxID=100861 RepID=A0A6G0XN44_9STRA|nr:hypothetical protein Ae201684_003080 [Aphanomyces euteiches]